MLRTRTTSSYVHQYDYVIKLNIFLRGKSKQESILWLTVYLPSTKCLSIILTYRVLAWSSRQRAWSFIYPYAHLCWGFPMSFTDGLMITFSLYWLPKLASYQVWLPALCPQVGGEDVLTSGVPGGAIKLACLMSMVLTFSKSSGPCGFFYRLWLVEAAFCQQMGAMRSLVWHSCYPVHVLYSWAP